MATIKSFSDLQQSKKLAEILPLESADMCWTNHCYGSMRSSMTISAKSIYEYKKLLERFADSTSIDVFYPAWSLAALLSLIPQEIFDGEYIINITEGINNRWVVTYDKYENRNHSYYGLSTGADNLIDACYELILKLHELKML